MGATGLSALRRRHVGIRVGMERSFWQIDRNFNYKKCEKISTHFQKCGRGRKDEGFKNGKTKVGLCYKYLFFSLKESGSFTDTYLRS